MSHLTLEMLAHVGRSRTPVMELATRREIRKYSVASRQTLPKYLEGVEAPPLFYVALFWDVVSIDQMTPDGLSVDSLLPELPWGRVMAGGIKTRYFQPIRCGDYLVRPTHLDRPLRKGRQVRSSRLLRGYPRCEDGHRRAGVGRKDHAHPALNGNAMSRIENISAGDALPERRHTPTILDLFFYNAALWNGHRIHFDESYATAEEGYPGLVIQGPLQGDWMSQCVMEWLAEEGALQEFEYSNRSAAYVGETLVVGGTVTAVDAKTGEVALEVFVKNEAGEVIAPGTARVRIA